MEFFARLQGGEGPDVWDKELFIDAADFIDAAGQANARAEELRGQVTELSQCDCSEEEEIGRAVNRFLSWTLPDSVTSDPCSTQPGSGRYGTNLLNAHEAREMLRHVRGIL